MPAAPTPTSPATRRRAGGPRLLTLALLVAAGAAGADPASLSDLYRARVTPRLEVPEPDAARYAALASAALREAGASTTHAQYVALVDRNANVQAILLILLYWIGADGQATRLIGASPVSTGRGGTFDHFETPLGVFAHTHDNLDFRAEGTYNELGIRGYGAKGMRVYDLGWQQALRLWGKGGMGTMRLQMHATDPDRLEPRLGSSQSKGCIRIPATLNYLLDQHAVLHADYLALQADGVPLWVLPSQPEAEAHAGRYVVVIDSLAARRPRWSPVPGSGRARR